MKSLVAILPSAGVLFLFWLAIRGLTQADRRERESRARIEGEWRTATVEDSSSPSESPQGRESSTGSTTNPPHEPA